MNNTLIALSIQLHHQRDELFHALLALDQQIENLDTQIHDSQTHILDASMMPEKILPELEMTRLHYILSQQQQQDALHQLKADLLSKQSLLHAQHLRKNTELKRLEKYQTHQRHIEQQKDAITQQNNRDEWILLNQSTQGAFQ